MRIPRILRWPSAAALLILAALVVPAALLPLSGCGGGAPRDGLPALEDVNVLLIVVDTMGAGHIGCLTPGLDTTPRMDALAAESVFFTRAYSTAPWTQPAISSLLTGLTPSHHRTLHLWDRMPDQVTTLAEYLAPRGFATSGIVTHLLLEERLGYRQGFEAYDASAVAGHRGICSPRATELAVAELERLRDRRFFLMVHLFDPHSRYLHHPRFDRTSGYDGPARDWDMEIGKLRDRRFDMAPADVDYLRGLYREEIAFTDHHVGLILDRLDELGLAGNTLVILTADHGEEFMEHGWIGHTRYLHDTLLHVPLMFRLPGRLQPARVATPASLTDVVPTLLDLSRAPEAGAAALDGVSLRPALAGRAMDPGRPIFSEVAFLAPPEEQGTPLAEKEAFKAAVTAGGWRLIHDLDAGTWRLFDLQDDPGELHDRYAPDDAHARDLQPLLQEWMRGKVENWGRSFAEPVPLSDEDRERLRSLGYVR